MGHVTASKGQMSVLIAKKEAIDAANELSLQEGFRFERIFFHSSLSQTIKKKHDGISGKERSQLYPQVTTTRYQGDSQDPNHFTTGRL
mmetsp:Transcript_27375/g.63554  ORF Transcript_27375/g.63554 Transcript_27375/m.63554 type:complete len:88 (+) Transcript_27375:689-952(+)